MAMEGKTLRKGKFQDKSGKRNEKCQQPVQKLPNIVDVRPDLLELSENLTAGPVLFEEQRARHISDISISMRRV